MFFLKTNIQIYLFNSIFVLYFVETISIPLLYELLCLIFKRVHFAVTIIIFYIAISLGIYSQYLILTKNIVFLNEQIAFILIVIFTILFGIFTYFPPKIFLFRDPSTGGYGDTGRHR